MPAHRKYTKEQRKEVDRLWQIGRNGIPGEKQHGRYTLKDISKRTGVNYKTCWMIATGQR